MPVPYTMEAVATLRHAAAHLTPIQVIQQQLGWDSNMLASVCRQHGIDIAPPAVAASVTRPRGPVLSPAEKLAQFIGHLSPRQADAMKMLCAASAINDAYIPATAISGSEPRDCKTRAVGRVIQILNSKLADERMPYRIDVRTSEGYAYRLKFGGAKL